MEIIDIIRSYYSCYETGDKAALENLLDERFEFSSPHDSKLYKPSCFEKCWGFNKIVKKYHIGKFIQNKKEAFISYKAFTHDSREIDNAEYFEIKDGKIIYIKVYYGNL
jgi:hypothetical protein